MHDTNALLDLLRFRWLRLWAGLGIPDAAAVAAEFDLLAGKYLEPHRAYHVLDHIDQGLALFDALADTIACAMNGAVYPMNRTWFELAWWFHDAEYDPLASDNEARSARLLRGCAERLLALRPLCPAMGNGFDFDATDFLAASEDLILATTHAASLSEIASPHERRTTAWFLDIDLSILGQPDAVYDAYERGIRTEYRAAPPALYVERRTAILIEFLRAGVFHTDVFRWKYLSQAEANLRRSIHRLRTEGADAFINDTCACTGPRTTESLSATSEERWDVCTRCGRGVEKENPC